MQKSRKKNFHIFIVLFIVVFANISLFANDIFSREGFYAYKLDNGLELYVQEDYSSTLMHVNYVTAAGVSSQSPENVGYFKLYSKLFWQNEKSPISSYKDLGCTDITASCNTDSSVYSFSVPFLSWKQAVNLFSQNIRNPEFSTSLICKETTQMHNEMYSFANSSSGFINSAIDAHIFSDSPWKHDSGVYPALFSDVKTTDCAMRIQLISDLYYTPNNSALFISGPEDAIKVKKMVESYFGSWKRSIYSFLNTPQNSELKSTENEKIDSDANSRRFVLVSDNFSPSMNQLVVQYTAPGLFANLSFSAGAYTLASYLENDSFKNNIISDSETGVIDTDYINAGFSQDGEYSRIIVQTLMNNGNFVNQVDHILTAIGKTVDDITEKQLMQIKMQSLVSLKEITASSISYMDTLASLWTYGGITYNTAFSAAIQQQTVESIKSVCAEDPWVFLVVHTDNYTKNKESLAQAGYKTISFDSNVEYIKSLYDPYIKVVKSTDFDTKQIEENDATVTTETPEEKAIRLWAKTNLANINQITLENGIPFGVKKISGGTNACILFTISGVNHGVAKDIDTVVAKIVSNLMRKQLSAMLRNGTLHSLPSVKSSSSLLSNSIQIDCLAEDAAKVVDSFVLALVHSSITPSQADESVFSHLYDVRTKNQSLMYQLYATAMKDFSDDKAILDYFDIKKEVLAGVTFDQITDAFSGLLDADRLSFVAAGNVDNTFIESAAQTLGVLKNFSQVNDNLEDVSSVNFNQTQTNSINLPIIQIPSLTHSVRLRHTFTTDIPAELAGPAPAELIPTTNFSDPAQLYLESPAITSSEFVLYRAMLELIVENLNKELRSMKNAPADSVTVDFSADMLSYACLSFNGVHSSNSLQKLVEKFFNSYLQEKESFIINDAKVLSIAKNFSGTTSADGIAKLMNEGLHTVGQVSKYINNYKLLGLANKDDFNSVLEYLSDKYSRSWIFSADTHE